MPRMPRRRHARSFLRLGAVALVCWMGAGHAVADTLRMSRVAIRGRLAPVGGSFFLFGDIDIDSVGRTVFTASLTDGRVAIFRSDPAGLTPILLTGDLAPQEADISYDVFLEVSGNARGAIAFIATTSPSQRQHVFLWSKGVVDRIASVGEEAPTSHADRFAAFDQVYLTDDGSVYFSAILEGEPEPRRGIFRHAAGATEPAIIPGLDFHRTRQVFETLQYDVNERGDIVALTRVTDSDLASAVEEDVVSEILLLSDGVLRTLASADFSLSGGVEQIRFFAQTFDQVHVNEATEASFFATTTNHLLGGCFLNASGEFLDNTKLAAEGDPSPLGVDDEYITFGAFDFNAQGTFIFHATTKKHPQGAFFLRDATSTRAIAVVGAERPEGIGLWRGFLKAELNEHNEFVLTDRDGLIQTGVFRGRIVPEVPVLLDQITALADGPGVSPSFRATLLRRMRVIERAFERDDERRLNRLVDVLRGTVNRAFDHIEEPVRVRLAVLIDDLLFLLGEDGSGRTVRR